MPKITNNEMLPDALVHAVSHDRYTKGDSDYSITELIAPAQQRQLRLKYADDIVEDASLRIWSLLGSAVHYVLENAAIHMKETGEWHDNYISEERFYYTMTHNFGDGKGPVISGQIDLYQDGVLDDFKLTSIWSIKDAIYKGKPEWDAQLNMQRFLMEKNGHKVDKLYITAIARDWNKAQSLRDRDYPPRACRIEIPMWSMSKTEDYIWGRINAHYSSPTLPCTPEECWEKLPTFALMKKGRQSAIRLMEDKKDLLDYALEKKIAKLSEGEIELPSDHSIVERPGARNRCQGYCDVADFCEQYQHWRLNVLGEEADKG